MKIAMILFGDYIHDGRVRRTVRALTSFNNDVYVFGIAQKPITYPIIMDGANLSILQLKTKKLSNHPLIQIIKFFEYYYRTLKILKKIKPEILHCNDITSLLLARYFLKRKYKIIYDSHEYWQDTQHKYLKNALFYKILAKLEKKLISKFEYVITVNNTIADKLMVDYKIRRPHIIMNIAMENHIKFSDCIRNKIAISIDSKIVLFIGGLSNGRGLNNLIHSCLYWNDDIKMVFLGSGSLSVELFNLVDKLNLQNKVFFLDPVPQDQVLTYVKSCDAGIIPYEKTCLNHYYALPNKLFQYAQMKVPILASNFPEMSKIINAYHLGTTFNPNDSKDIAKSVNDMFDNKFTISETDYESFIQDYNWDNEKKKLLRIYKDLELIIEKNL
jgi:glycosyltransferase involved in cell wall biosynthesis